MRNQSVPLIMSLVAIVVFGSTITINAQNVAKSCSYSDVQTAVKNAARGDTVTVPAGTCTWSSSLTLIQGINLIGAGAGNTVLKNIMGGANPHIIVQPDSTAISNEETFQIASFTFDGNNGTGQAIMIYGAADTGTKPFKNLIIGHNTFQNFGAGPANGCIYTRGQIRGVIYNNIFDRCNFILRPLGSDTTTEWSNTAYNNFSYGSADNLYFEDNTIKYSSPYTSTDTNGAMIQSEQGGRVVARFNLWDTTNLTVPGGMDSFWDVHGFQNYPGGQTGTMIVEYYDNMLSSPSSVNRLWNHRGSWGIFFDNTYTGPGTPNPNVDQYNGGCTNQIVPPSTNYDPEVNNTYVFNNVANGTTVMSMIAGLANACGISENADWWNYNSSFKGTTGIGRGLKSAIPATCTTGVAYWVTNEGSWNTTVSANTSGQFYKCISTNNWQLYYTPYAYPNPLRTAAPIGLKAVAK